jgi:hypothetical protein
MIAHGLPFHALSLNGREAESIAFFSTAARMRRLSSATAGAGVCSSSWLKDGMSCGRNGSMRHWSGASLTAAFSAMVLNEPARRLPEMPRMVRAWAVGSRSSFQRAGARRVSAPVQSRSMREMALVSGMRAYTTSEQAMQAVTYQ